VSLPPSVEPAAPEVTPPSRPPTPESAPPHAGGARRRELTRRRRRRLAISLVALAIVLAIGTVGFHWVAGTAPVESFYFESMLATGQGPPIFLSSAAAQIFASVMAFLSVGTVVSTLILNLGPIIGRLWREGIELAEREARKLEEEVEEEIWGGARKRG